MTIAAATAAAALAVISVTGGCKHEPTVDELVEQRIVVTKFDPQADFAAPTTFAIPDSVLFVSSFDAGPATFSMLDPDVAVPILQEISLQLTRRGYVEVGRNDGPDLGVAVTALSRLRTNTIQYGDWWTAGSASPTFWGYPGTYNISGFGYQTLAWRAGTLVIELDDLRAPREEAAAVDGGAVLRARVNVIWAALIHGVVGSATESIVSPPIDAIRQAFEQSPFIRH